MCDEPRSGLRKEHGFPDRFFVTETKRITHRRGADLIIDGVGRTTFKGDLEAAATRGHIVIFGAASGPGDPTSPNALIRTR